MSTQVPEQSENLFFPPNGKRHGGFLFSYVINRIISVGCKLGESLTDRCPGNMMCKDQLNMCSDQMWWCNLKCIDRSVSNAMEALSISACRPSAPGRIISGRGVGVAGAVDASVVWFPGGERDRGRLSRSRIERLVVVVSSSAAVLGVRKPHANGRSVGIGIFGMLVIFMFSLG